MSFFGFMGRLLFGGGSGNGNNQNDGGGRDCRHGDGGVKKPRRKSRDQEDAEDEAQRVKRMRILASEKKDGVEDEGSDCGGGDRRRKGPTSRTSSDADSSLLKSLETKARMTFTLSADEKKTLLVTLLQDVLEESSSTNSTTTTTEAGSDSPTSTSTASQKPKSSGSGSVVPPTSEVGSSSSSHLALASSSTSSQVCRKVFADWLIDRLLPDEMVKEGKLSLVTDVVTPKGQGGEKAEEVESNEGDKNNSNCTPEAEDKPSSTTVTGPCLTCNCAKSVAVANKADASNSNDSKDVVGLPQNQEEGSATKEENSTAVSSPSTDTTTNLEEGKAKKAINLDEEEMKDFPDFSDCTGFSSQKALLREHILFPLMNEELFLSRGLKICQGVVFHGSSFGIEFMARCLTKELARCLKKNVLFFHRKPTDFIQKYSVDAETMLEDFLKEAREVKEGFFVIFLEELDTFLNYCSSSGYRYNSSSNEKISEILDSIKQGEGLIIAGVDELKKVPSYFFTKRRFTHRVPFPEDSSDPESKKIILERLMMKWSPPSPELLDKIVEKTGDLNIEQLGAVPAAVYNIGLHRLLMEMDEGSCSHCKKDPGKLILDKGKLGEVDLSLEDWLNAVDVVRVSEKKAVVKNDEDVQDQGTPLTARTTTTTSFISKVEVEVDPTLNFGSVGGLSEQIQSLRENVIFPLKNAAGMKDWGVEPVRGMIFHGPPGTGKTLLGKALATELSQLDLDLDTEEEKPVEKEKKKKKFSFFYQKGTECFGMYMGDTEKCLRDLFEAAEKKKPAIIFFDEIDGLCPSRDNKGSGTNFYASVVTTMLGLMDGVKRGEVLVIAATNRLASIDPALLRPGRFDKCIPFHNPTEEGRKGILKVHTKTWKKGNGDEVLERVAKETDGYSGADLEQLCRQAFVTAMRRQFNKCMDTPSTPAEGVAADETPKKTAADFETFDILPQDWTLAMKSVKPMSRFGNFESASYTPTPLPSGLEKLLSRSLAAVEEKIRNTFVSEAECEGPEVRGTSWRGAGINSFLIWGTGEAKLKMINNFLLPCLLSSSSSPLHSSAVAFVMDTAVEGLTRSRVLAIMRQVLTPGEGKTGLLLIPNIHQLYTNLTGKGGSGSLAGFVIDELLALRGEGTIILATSGCPPDQLPGETGRLFREFPEASRSFQALASGESEVREFFSQIIPSSEEAGYGDILDRLVSFGTEEDTDVFDLLDLKGEIERVLATVTFGSKTNGASGATGNEKKNAVIRMELNRLLDSYKKGSRSGRDLLAHMFT